MSLCKISDCLYPSFARSMCRSHYARWRRGASVSAPIKPLTMSSEERLWSRVVKTPTCWLWTGSRNTCRGQPWHGRMTINGSRVLVHRFSFFLAYGRWPQPMCLHKCDVPACVNPAHLEEGTNAKNMADMVARGRHVVAARGSDHHKAKLTEADVRIIRNLLANNVPQRTIADRFGVSDVAISHIKNGKSWRHVL